MTPHHDDLIARSDRALASAILPDSPDCSASRGTHLPTFPVHVLPAPLREYVTQAAEALGVAPCMVAIPILALAAATIGNTAEIEVKPGWRERAILWLGVVGLPGSGKSPALDAARRLIDPLQADAWAAYAAANVAWEEASSSKRAPGAVAAAGAGGDRPELESYLTTDCTKEALSGMLQSSPGIAVVRDELTAWVKSFDAYRKGGDRQDWLSGWSGAPLKPDRKTANPIYVPRPCVSVIGGVQPDLLADLLMESSKQDGFFDRFDLIWPEARALRWSEAEIDPTVEQRAVALFSRLRPRAQGRGIRPIRIHPLSQRARAAFAAWFDRNADEQECATGLMAGALAKSPRKLARWALILHILWYPDSGDGDEILEDMVTAAIELVAYLRHHLEKVLDHLGAAGLAMTGLEVRIRRLLLRRLHEHPDDPWLSATDINDGLGGHTRSEEYTPVLASLVAAGLAESDTIATGKRPREVWRWAAEIRTYPDKSVSELNGYDAHAHSYG